MGKFPHRHNPNTHYAYVGICASVFMSIWQDCGDGLLQSVGSSTAHAAERFIAKLWCVKCTHIIAKEQHCLVLLFQHLLWKWWTTNTHSLTHVGTCAHVHVHSLINVSAKSHLGPGNDKTHTHKHAYNESSHLTMSNKTFSSHTQTLAYIWHASFRSTIKLNERKEINMKIKGDRGDTDICMQTDRGT